MKKRAISPLVAWVLMIGFTIGIGVLVSNFIIKQTEKTFKPEELAEGVLYCDGVAITVDDTCHSRLPNNPQDWELIKLNIKNRGSFTVTKLGVTIKDLRPAVSSIIDLTATPYKPIKPGDIVEAPLSLNDGGYISDLQNIGADITLVPIIVEEGRNVSCSEKIFILTKNLLGGVDCCGKVNDVCPS